MSKTTSRIAAAAMFALAALPAFALTHAAQAAEPAARVAVGDLNNPSQAAAFNAELNSEADRVCKAIDRSPSTGSKIRVSHASCVQDVRNEALSQLSSNSRASVELAATPSTVQVAGR